MKVDPSLSLFVKNNFRFYPRTGNFEATNHINENISRYSHRQDFSEKDTNISGDNSKNDQ